VDHHLGIVGGASEPEIRLDLLDEETAPVEAVEK
jgi:hypothetical protein